ncbi:MAG: hypothetical protein WBB82_05065 [Limnothrix sp.]
MIHLIYSDKFLEHDTGRPHPESARRLLSITKALRRVSWADQLVWHEPESMVQRDASFWVKQIHDEDYLAKLKQMADGGGGHWDGDTVVSPRSFDVAMLAVQACLDGVDLVLKTGEIAFVLVRPPRSPCGAIECDGVLFAGKCGDRRPLWVEFRRH